MEFVVMPDGTVKFIDQNNRKDSWEDMLEARASYYRDSERLHRSNE